MSICTRYERNKEYAEELLNQAFLKILMNLDKYNDKVPLKVWMRRIAINTIIDEYRKNKRMKEAISYNDFSEENYPANSYDVNEYLKKADAEEILIMIEKLPEMSQNVFNMYVIDGFSHKEIAGMLGISDGTSRWYLNLAKTELRKNFQKHNISTS
jgi:RNA polymerase sigma factor (sigma-70 family)